MVEKIDVTILYATNKDKFNNAVVLKEYIESRTGSE